MSIEISEMRTVKEYVVLDPLGKEVGKYKGLRRSFESVGANYNPSSYSFEDLKKKGYCKTLGHYIVLKGKEVEVRRVIEDNALADREIERMDKLIGILGQRPVLLLDVDFKISGTFTRGLKDISQELNLPLGTVKAKLHRDKKIMLKMLSGDSGNRTENGTRLMYLEDYCRIMDKLRDIYK